MTPAVVALRRRTWSDVTHHLLHCYLLHHIPPSTCKHEEIGSYHLTKIFSGSIFAVIIFAASWWFLFTLMKRETLYFRAGKKEHHFVRRFPGYARSSFW
jgi:hypothetical protein